MVVLWTDGETERTDRRRWDRYSPDGQTSVTLASGGCAFDCELLDLSLGGARLRIDGDLPDDRDVVLQHRVAGLFFASQTWRHGNEVGVRFRVPAQTREHALQCATVLLYGDVDEVLDLPAVHGSEGARPAS